MSRINNFKNLLWGILGLACAVGLTRFLFGLGSTSNLTDNTPWGFWVGFDVMGGVALAAGGFVIAAFNYIFGKKEMHPISRAAILTAFLGYVAVAVGLLFDLGLPWNIWHMIIYWNPHSPLFEVGWCVMLYLTVLTLEFAPVVLEKYPIGILKRIYELLYKIRIPLVVLGIMLSTLHQSSLGSLFLAMPYRLHPLWYSPIIPIIFFSSAICLGFMMVMVESMTTAWLYRRPYEFNILNKLAKFASFALIIYLILRFADIIIRGASPFLFISGWSVFLFWLELMLSVIIPLVIFAIPNLRQNVKTLYFGALSGVFGIVFNRLNVGGLTHLNNLTEIGSFYFPSWMELTISAGVVSLAMLAFFYFVENFRVWEQPPVDIDSLPERKVKFDKFNVYLGPSSFTNRVKFSFAFVLAFAIAFGMISEDKLNNAGVAKITVRAARGGDTLIIDGNRDGYFVKFAHKMHENKGLTCGQCHHMNKPDDKSTRCSECHYDMYASGDAFKHDWHSSSEGANLSCFECHSENDSKGRVFVSGKENAIEICDKCHKNFVPPDAFLREIKAYKTISYVESMHERCIGCHESILKNDKVLANLKPQLANCNNCHKDQKIYKKEDKLFKRRDNKWVVIPM